MPADQPRAVSELLHGLRVVSLALQLPGPYCGMLLADLGADVIIVEPLTGGDPARYVGGATAPGETGEFFRTFNRNKRSLALNLKHPSGQDVLHRLLTTSDVLLEGFRPGVADRLGIGRAAISVRHPHLVYASISGYGQSGADSNVTGHDLSYVSRAAIVAPKVPLPDGSEFILPLADLTAGALTAVGVLAAIFGRQHGRAQYLDVSLSESVLSWVAPLLEMHLNDATVEAMREPAYGTFRCGDGRDITLSVAFEDHFWNALCTELGLVNLEHLRSSERRRRTAELRASIERRLSTDSAASWVSRLAAAGVPVGPVPDIEGVLDDRHFVEREMYSGTTRSGDRIRKVVSNPIIPVDERKRVHRPAPELGEHNGEILAELGLSRYEVSKLRDDGAVA